MAYRKFKGIEYPVPGVDAAINTLRPGPANGTANTGGGGGGRGEGTQPNPGGGLGGSGIVIIAYPTT
jgi:hypothetical protein